MRHAPLVVAGCFAIVASVEAFGGSPSRAGAFVAVGVLWWMIGKAVTP